MIQSQPVAIDIESFPMSPSVRQILAHLCEGDCHAYGDLIEWCESRADCSHVVVCPACRKQFVIDDDELAELRQWTIRNGSVFVCGVRYDER